jgi:hypothetical protein
MMADGKTWQEEPGNQGIAEYRDKQCEKARQLKELQRGRMTAARAHRMVGKNLQATVFAVHDTSPLGREYRQSARIERKDGKNYCPKGRIWGTGRKGKK